MLDLDARHTTYGRGNLGRAEQLLLVAAAEIGKPLANVGLAAEAMVTIAFNLGAAAIDLSEAERRKVVARHKLEGSDRTKKFGGYGVP